MLSIKTGPLIGSYSQKHCHCWYPFDLSANTYISTIRNFLKYIHTRVYSIKIYIKLCLKNLVLHLCTHLDWTGTQVVNGSFLCILKIENGIWLSFWRNITCVKCMRFVEEHSDNSVRSQMTSDDVNYIEDRKYRWL